MRRKLNNSLMDEQIWCVMQTTLLCSSIRPPDVTTMQTLLMARLAQFGLSISEKKTHQTYLGSRSHPKTQERRQMTFLGFTIYRAKNRSGTASKTVFVTNYTRYGRAKAAIKAKILQLTPTHSRTGSDPQLQFDGSLQLLWDCR
ncbi:MAG: hypothetical protein IPK04_12970 [Bdellovibrionales bacterium]|nr:hypothetical protein [Bdellovibrionales bacterium]